MSIEIREANLTDAADARALLEILDSYARDPMGGGEPLSAEVRERLVPALCELPQRLVLLAFVEERPIGLAICFHGFSTFAARPLLNVHDLAVLPEYRGRGGGRALLEAATAHARKRGCAKVTLEVREDNARARALYASCGFRDFDLAGESHRALFLSKPLGASADE
jgi:ribosomal protein S18 acetylase RimI-like enzyme